MYIVEVRRAVRDARLPCKSTGPGGTVYRALCPPNMGVVRHFFFHEHLFVRILSTGLWGFVPADYLNDADKAPLNRSTCACAWKPRVET